MICELWIDTSSLSTTATHFHSSYFGFIWQMCSFLVFLLHLVEFIFLIRLPLVFVFFFIFLVFLVFLVLFFLFFLLIFFSSGTSPESDGSWLEGQMRGDSACHNTNETCRDMVFEPGRCNDNSPATWPCSFPAFSSFFFECPGPSELQCPTQLKSPN